MSGDRNTFTFLPKIEFSTFGWINPRIWIKKCNRYFNLCKILECQKVKKNVECNEFIVDVCDWLKEELGGKIVEDFNRLQQVGSVDEYLDRFKELKLMLL